MINYYVDANNGLDTNDGLTKDTALLTLQTLLDSIISFTEDTTIYLSVGTYICDNAIITKIPANVTVTVIGNKYKTILKPLNAWGSVGGDYYPIGVSGATLNICKLYFNMENMHANNADQCMNINLNINNSIIYQTINTGYGNFVPYNSTYTFTNCIFIGLYKSCAR